MQRNVFERHGRLIRVAGIAATLVLPLVFAGLRAPSPRPADRSAAACDAPEHRQFDFWLGTWDVDQRIRAADGSYKTFTGRDTVMRALDGCAVVERWHGTVEFFWDDMTQPERMAGLSVRAFDPDSGVWNIHWMDTRSPSFGEPFTGRFKDGRGVFTLERTQADGTETISRITFDGIEEDSFDWELAISRDDGETWMVLWAAEFRRRT